MRISQTELAKMMTDVVKEITTPLLALTREALDTVERLEVQLGYAERVSRLETQVEELTRRLEKLDR